MEAKQGYIKKLFPRVSDIKNAEIREKVISFWWDAWKESKFSKIEHLSQWEPSREKLDISNVEHTNQVVECAIAIAQVVKREQNLNINMDTLIAASILHDADKILMFDPSNGNMTHLGTYLPHTGIAAHLALQAGLPLDIVHAIASHSPNYSSVPPKTIEAVILYHADQIVTKTWTISRNIDISFDLKR
jgi:HD superfamily phosphohydrolase YqeK